MDYGAFVSQFRIYGTCRSNILVEAMSVQFTLDQVVDITGRLSEIRVLPTQEKKIMKRESHGSTISQHMTNMTDKISKFESISAFSYPKKMEYKYSS